MPSPTNTSNRRKACARPIRTRPTPNVRIVGKLMPHSDPFPDQDVKLPEPKSDHRNAAESNRIGEDSSPHGQLLPSHLIRRGQVRELLDIFTWAASFEGCVLRPTWISYS